MSDGTGSDPAGGGETISVFAPWPIFTVTIERASDGTDEVYFHPGGQGVWVARMAASLGCDVTLVGPVGGESGRIVEALVATQEAFSFRPVRMHGATGGYVHDRRGGARKEIAHVPFPSIDRHETDDLYSAGIADALRCGTAVVTGVPEDGGIDATLCGRLIADLAKNDVTVIADLSGEMIKAIGGGVAVLKISHEELVEAGLAASGELADLCRGARELRDIAENVVVSCAGEGTLALFGAQFYWARPPRIAAADPTGAGDSMTAALAVARARELPPVESLRLATAAGALNVTRRGRGTGSRRDVEALASSIEIEELDG